jgi:hypothetical protein
MGKVKNVLIGMQEDADGNMSFNAYCERYRSWIGATMFKTWTDCNGGEVYFTLKECPKKQIPERYRHRKTNMVKVVYQWERTFNYIDHWFATKKHGYELNVRKEVI